MTHVPTTDRTEPRAQVAADVTAIDVAARSPVLLLLGSGLVWLMISGVLALITSIQLHSPQFLSQYSFLTYGRGEAMRETAFIYGWAGNAGLGVALWLLARLGGNPLRGLNWAFAGTLFWNLGLLLGLIGIGAGEMTSFPLFQLPAYVQPFMVVAYIAIVIPGVLAWMGRRTDTTFAAQWYAIAALFVFPWLSSIAQLVLLWTPLRGVSQAIGAGWFAQGLWTLWLTPLALAAAYYVIARASGRVLPNYDAAPLAFWTLIVVGAWTGARHLIGGPIPVWIVSTAIVGAVVLLVHYAIVAMNLRSGFGVRGTGVGLVRLGVLAYVLAGVLDAVTAFRSVAVLTQFTFLGTALQQLALYGGISVILLGAIYFMVPRLTGSPWVSATLAVGHRWLLLLGLLVLLAALVAAGVLQSADLTNKDVPFSDLVQHIKTPLMIASAGQLTLLVASILLLVNFLQTASASVAADVAALNPIREAKEGAAS